MALSKLSNDSFGGLNVRNEEEINISLFCGLCKLLLFVPTQLLCCGTRLCSWCSKHGLPDSRPFFCPFCRTKQPKKEALTDKGTGRELNVITTECYKCSWKGPYKDYIEHLQQYHANLECDGCHKQFSIINLFEEHRQEICEHRHIPCGLPGCTELVKRPDMKSHYSHAKHQMILVELICQYIDLKNHKSSDSDRLSSRRQMEQDWRTAVDSVDILLSGLETLFNESIRLKSELDAMKTSVEQTILQSNEAAKSINESNEKVLQQQKWQVEMEKDMNETKKLMTKIRSLDLDGTITFSFNNHNHAITSSIFRTSPYGYPFILRLCENDGYLSIFISLLRGDFDSILFYPFSYDIYLCLCDQSGERTHIVSTIKTDLNSSLFSRPTNEKNGEIGIIKFCPLNSLNDAQSSYVRDGVFFIRVFIDFMNTGLHPFT